LTIEKRGRSACSTRTSPSVNAIWTNGTVIFPFASTDRGVH
jgi:hypothetical protein